MHRDVVRTTSPVPDLLASPERCTLVVVDAQRAYLDAATSPFPWRPGQDRAALAVVHAIGSTAAAARRAGVPVVWTRGAEGGPGAPDQVRLRFDALGDAAVVLVGTPAYELVPDLVDPGEPVIDKDLPGAFSSPRFTRLMSHLRATGRDTVVVVGAYAGKCVLATALGALERRFHPLAVPEAVFAHPGRPGEMGEFKHTFSTTVGHLVPAATLQRCWAVR